MCKILVPESPSANFSVAAALCQVLNSKWEQSRASQMTRHHYYLKKLFSYDRLLLFLNFMILSSCEFIYQHMCLVLTVGVFPKLEWLILRLTVLALCCTCLLYIINLSHG